MNPSVTECDARVRLVERLPYSKRNTDFAVGNFDFQPMGPRAPFKVLHRAKVFGASLKQELFISTADESGIDGNILDPIRVSHDPIITSAMYCLRYEMLQDFPCGAIRGDSIAAVIANRIMSLTQPEKANAHVPRGGLSRAGLQLVTAFIKENFQSDITIDELSAIVHMSPYHFCRMFKQSTGLSAYQYVIRCRMEYAKTLLSSGKLSIKQVARAVGFYDQSHFTRHFKRCIGSSPTAYQASQALTTKRIEPEELS